MTAWKNDASADNQAALTNVAVMMPFFWLRRIDLNRLRLSPALSAPTLSARMTLTGLFIDAGAVAADCNGFAAVAVPVVLQALERCHPRAGLLRTLEWPAWAVRPVFHGAEQRLRVAVVVAEPRP